MVQETRPWQHLSNRFFALFSGESQTLKNFSALTYYVQCIIFNSILLNYTNYKSNDIYNTDKSLNSLSERFCPDSIVTISFVIPISCRQPG